jgi:hypothetical protein
MIRIRLLLIALLFGRLLVAQSLTPNVINSSGNVLNTTNLSLEWSLGEISTNTVQNSNFLLTQGFLQPHFNLVKAVDISTSIRLVAYPNPTSDILNFVSDDSSIATVQICDISGRILLAKDYSEQITITDFSDGCYFLHFFNAKHQLIHILKITKI